MIHVAKKNKTGIPDEQVTKLTDKYISILELAANEYENNPPPKDYMDRFNLQKRLRGYQNHPLYFLKHPYVDYTNNISERELRKFKRKQKQKSSAFMFFLRWRFFVNILLILKITVPPAAEQSLLYSSRFFPALLQKQL